jgi:hypothetical protein
MMQTLKTSIESEPIIAQAGPAPVARRETTLPARLIVTMDDCDYVVKHLLRRDDADLSRRLYQYVVTFPLWEKLVRRAQLKHLQSFTRDSLLFTLCCQLVREDRKDGQPDLAARARIWRHFAEQCAEGKSEVSEAQAWEITSWIPKERSHRCKKETRHCTQKMAGGQICDRPFRVSPNSDRSKCPEHHLAEKFPGMAYKN